MLRKLYNAETRVSDLTHVIMICITIICLSVMLKKLYGNIQVSDPTHVFLL